MQESNKNSQFNYSLVDGHIPKENEVKFSIGPYKVIDSIGKGGMGEVFLAFDTTCGRRIALKRIRPDLLDYQQINNRFLKEAHVTSQLMHPSIIPIYAIHKDDKQVYYTMPYVQGETLKQIIRKTRLQEKKGDKLDHIGGSIPALIRIFINICQAIAYAHSKNVLHRDIKSENIIVGHYGEVLILDWGLAKLVREKEEASEETDEETEVTRGADLSGLTRIGKVVGTMSYMAPERALGHQASFQTDIYSLGVVLYQILTLRLPFQRGTLKEFRSKMAKETLKDPAELAPYRDVPRVLSKIVSRCLDANPAQRYQSVEELIRDIENYAEGRSEWFQIAELNPKRKEDWEFQENVYLAEHIAITRASEASDWMSLMISKASLSENIRLEADIQLGETAHGIGFLMNIPESSERKHLNDGYCLWIGSDINKSTKLIRSTVEVMHAPEIVLTRGQWHKVRIDKIDNKIQFFLDGILQFSYISHLPLVGTHVGLLSRDVDYTIKDFFISVGGQNITVKCLAVPDAFLAHKDYATALSEYRRIGYSFPGRAEGREAMFRAGITLLEQAKNSPNITKAEEFLELALVEFEKLHSTPGAPLEYLGKALVYQTSQEYDEEVRCFELACRKYPKHPLLPVLYEQIIYRMHESSRYHRKVTYHFILLVLRLLPEETITPHSRKLFRSLKNHWEALPFILKDKSIETSRIHYRHNFAVQLAFWLAKGYIIEEIIDLQSGLKLPSAIVLGNALISLIKLGSVEIAQKKLDEVKKLLPPVNADLFQQLIHYERKSREFDLNALLPKAAEDLTEDRVRALCHVCEIALDRHQETTVHKVYEELKEFIVDEQLKLTFDAYEIWALLSERRWEEAQQLIRHYPIEVCSNEHSPLHSLYGCLLYATEGKELALIHFAGILDVFYPHTTALLGYYLSGRIDENNSWFQRSFPWERRQLQRQLELFNRCSSATKN